jgi:hypothetical protein
VEKVNVYTFYDLARELRHVHALPDDVLAVTALWPIMQARMRINNLVDKGDPIPLGVSKPHAIAVQSALNSLNATYHVDDGNGGTKWEFPKDDLSIPTWKISLFRSSLETFETVFSAEMGELATYFVPRRGIFHTPALVDTADETFPAEVRSEIPEKTKVEWRAAGRCLAFSLLSASGFHVARAVEGTMEAYYRAFIGSEPKEITWGKYLEDLQAASKKPGGPTEKTLIEIAQMKDDYRNPLMHPRVVLTEPDAKILFGNGESLIIAMAGEIKKVAQLPLVGGQGATLLAGTKSP